MDSTRKFSAKLNSLMKKLLIHHKISYHRLPPETKKAKPRLAPRGCVAMYVGAVGEEGKRYDVPINLVSTPSIHELIIRSEEDDLDFKIDGPIRLFCSTAYFDQLLKLANQLKIG